jgi:hypothetical protein
MHMSYGKQLVEAITADMGARTLEPDCRETQVLSLVGKLGDQLEQLEAAIDRDGVSSTLRGGRIVANPLIAEHTKIATAISKLLETVAMDEGAPVDLAKRRAAQARWKANRAAKSGGA